MSTPRRTLEDEILVLEARAGDREAFQRLVARWQEPLWRHALRLLGREDLAWDVVQDTWMHVVRGLRRLEDPGAFPRWVYTIASRRAAERRRARGREPAALEGSEPEAPPPAADDTAAHVRHAIAHLDGAQRVILALRYLEGFSVAEVASILDVPEGTVKSRLHHAREKLRTILEKTP